MPPLIWLASAVLANPRKISGIVPARLGAQLTKMGFDSLGVDFSTELAQNQAIVSECYDRVGMCGAQRRFGHL